MATHVKALAVIHIALGALGIVGALVILLVFGGLAGLAGHAADPDARLAVPILGGLGGIIAVVVIAVSLPGVIAGVGLLEFRPWARVLTLVLCGLNLLNVPVGTAIGVYGFWALLNRETEQLFARQ